MLRKKIKWTKAYHENLGTQDKDGLYDYAYCYFIYEFVLPNNDKIKFRRYADTADKCSMFAPLDALMQRSDNESKDNVNSIAAILHFMRTNFGIHRFDFFDKTYKSIDLDNFPNAHESFSFEEESTR